MLICVLPIFAQSNYVANEILVQLKEEVSSEELEQYISEKNWIDAQPELLFKALKVYRLQLRDRDAKTVLSDLRSTSLFEEVQLNHIGIQRRDSIPMDGNYSAQWYLRQIEAPAAWDIATGGGTKGGDSIVIAIVDEGFDRSHPDLNFYQNPHEIAGNAIDDDQNGYVDDVNGWNCYDDNGSILVESHGTMIAGIAGATGNNVEGIAGINWRTQILPVLGLTSDEATVVKAYNYVYEMRRRYNETNGDSGAYVVVCNSSFGIDRAKPADYPLWCAMYETMGEVGILNVAATANWNQNVDVEGDIPTTCPSDYLVAVTSTNKSDFLSTSPGAAYGPVNIDIGAPGVSMFSTTINGNYTSKNGTSYAAPVVTGAIALMYSALCQDLENIRTSSPDSLALLIREYLLVDGVDQIASLDSKIASGGRINLYKTLRAVSDCFAVGEDESYDLNSDLIFPNPNFGNFSFYNANPKAIPFSVISSDGSLVREGMLEALETKSFELVTKGIYFMVIGDQTNQKVEKIVVY